MEECEIAHADCDPLDAGARGVCGGEYGETCMDDEYCRPFLPGECGRTGACTARPMACSGTDAEVCGCDGMRYATRCHARAAGVDEYDYYPNCPL